MNAGASLWTYALVVLGMVMNVGAQVALKFAVQGGGHLTLSEPRALLGLMFNPWLLGGLVLYAASVINWLVVLSRLDLGIAYPLMGAGYILAFLAGVYWFKEPVSATRIAGIIVIILGVILLTRPVAAHV
jgi:multidrug transporter EmrE-like cation transporter